MIYFQEYSTCFYFKVKNLLPSHPQQHHLYFHLHFPPRFRLLLSVPGSCLIVWTFKRNVKINLQTLRRIYQKEILSDERNVCKNDQRFLKHFPAHICISVRPINGQAFHLSAAVAHLFIFNHTRP